MTFYVTIVFPLSQCPSCHMWDGGTRWPARKKTKHRWRLSIRLPVRARSKREMWDFCFDLCRWTSFSPPRLIHRALWEHSAPVLRNHELFFCVWNVDCWQGGAAQRGTPFRKTRQGDFILSPRKRLMTGFSAFFQCDGTKAQEWLGVQKFCWSVEAGKKNPTLQHV